MFSQRRGKIRTVNATKRIITNAAKARISQAKSLDDPSLRAGSYDMSNNPVNVNGQTEMLQQRYGVSQKIPFPGKSARQSFSRTRWTPAKPRALSSRSISTATPTPAPTIDTDPDDCGECP